MRIAVASGKGGTGKTTVAVNLALSIEKKPIYYFDCDVEEPNAHIFLKPEFNNTEPLGIMVPRVDFTRCDYCGMCADACEYSAILVARKKLMIFDELCHGCYACQIVCKPHKDAITMVLRETAKLEEGPAKSDIHLVHAKLNLGEPMPTPVIAQLKKRIPGEGITIIDSPPGNSDSMVEAVIDSDFVILATEPTPFGLHDLKIAVDTLRRMNLPMGIVVNRSDLGDRELWKYSEDENIPILLEIPFDRKIAEAYSKGVPVVEALPQYREKFVQLFESIEEFVNKGME